MTRTGLSRISIVIPTYKRPLFVLRQYKYWRDTDAQVVVLDGSPQPLVIPETLSSANLRYVHSGKSFVERLKSASQYVLTPYCIMLGDDEFLTYSGLRAAIKRLDDDHSIIGCVGRCLYFFVDQERFLLADAYREWKSFSQGTIDQRNRLDEDLPPNKTHMAHYAIMRSRIWAQIMANAYEREFSCAYAYERLVNLQRALHGKTEILENLLWFRSMENRNTYLSTSGGPDFLTWARSPRYADEISVYRKMARQLMLNAGVNPVDVPTFEERWFTVGVKLTVLRKSTFKARFRRWFRPRLFRWTPKYFRLFAKRHVPNRLLRFTGWQGFDVDDTLNSLSDRSTYFDLAEIEFIRDLSIATALDRDNLESESRAR